ncbi:E3 ubiquitin-protein ligase rnf213-alpha isoform X2 [Polypterus senegalus]|uniref:E3 ubiquitin-protein ligase rnf213-alpha isoform X2 n=1 Tax=Polypterus senegalus TaxID=55291 RepID=UPI00196686D9|nr:E3 ubiquitin-protein ligase rnf213-alpha isoform X2 [Polypterus senegalus]
MLSDSKGDRIMDVTMVDDAVVKMGDSLSADMKDVKPLKEQKRPSEDQNEIPRARKKKKKSRKKVQTEERLSVAGDRSSSDFSDITQEESASSLQDISLETVEEKKDVENNVSNHLENNDKGLDPNISENHDIQMDENEQLSLEAGVEAVSKGTLKAEEEVKDFSKDFKHREDRTKNLLPLKSDDQSASDCLNDFQHSESSPISAPADSPTFPTHVQEMDCSVGKNKNYAQVLKESIKTRQSSAEKIKNTEHELTTPNSATMEKSTHATPKKGSQLNPGKNKGEKEREDDCLQENQSLPKKSKCPELESSSQNLAKTKSTKDSCISGGKDKGEKQVAGDSLKQSKTQRTDSSPTPDVSTSAAYKDSHKKDSNLKSDSNKAKGKQKNAKSPAVSQQHRQQQPQQIPFDERLTIYFHAILSKDFNLDRDRDKVILRAGDPIGNWEENLTEITVRRDLDECGLLVEGCLVVSKKNLKHVSIPYKYVIYKAEKNYFQFEHIYKAEVTGIANRCLFIRENLLDDRGEWHQYDDFICAEPSKNLIEKVKKKIWGIETNVVSGRNTAGNVMLETIFELLTSWTEINLKSFFVQLNQFFMTYKDPYVFEDKAKKWKSLNYGEEQVKKILKTFMIERILNAPMDLEKGIFITDSLKSAMVIVIISTRYRIFLSSEEISQICGILCVQQMPKDKSLNYYRELSNCFASELKNLEEAIIGFCKTAIMSRNPHWIKVIPLLHFVNGACKPFEYVPAFPYMNIRAWAGLQMFSEGTDLRFAGASALLDIIKAKKHLFEADKILARSCLYLMKLEDLSRYFEVVHVELLDVLYGLFHKLSGIYYSNFETVLELLLLLHTNLSKEIYSLFEDPYPESCLKMAVRLLQKVCESTKEKGHFQIPLRCLSIVILISDFVTSHTIKVSDNAKEGEVKPTKNAVLNEVLEIKRNWIKETFKNKLIRSSYVCFHSEFEIEMWSMLLSLSFRDEKTTSFWRKTLLNDFEGKLKQETPLHQIDIYCSKNDKIRQLSSFLSDCFEKCAFDAVNFICQEKSEAKLFDLIKKHDLYKFGELVSKIIEKSWPKDHNGKFLDGYDVVVEHLLGWSAAKNVFQLQGADGKIIEKLTDNANELIAVANSAFTAIAEQFIQGNIEIKYLKKILKRKDEFLVLVKLCHTENKRCKGENIMKKILKWRENELCAVLHEKELVTSFLTMCRKINEYVKVVIEFLEEKARQNIDAKKLDEAVEVLLPDDCIYTESPGTVSYFNLNDEIRDMAEKINTFKDCHIFQIFWEKKAKSLAVIDTNTNEIFPDPDLSITTAEEVLDIIFEPCFDEYCCIFERIKNASITLEEVDTVFKDYKDLYENLTKDLQIMSRLEKDSNMMWVTNRVRQIQQYHQLHLAVESANVILEVKDALGLGGNFKILQTLLNVTREDFKKDTLDRIDNELIKAKEILEDITDTRRKCLLELGNRKNLINWVKESLEDINELKVFVDLASISAGENDLDVDRVACFHDAVLGYSSMLYDLKPDAGFNVFMESLKKLWKALESDPDLPKKLRDTARHLEWLKSVKDSHGSVELSSLSLATAINNKGIYIIRSQQHKKLSLDTALQLKIPEEHEDGFPEFRHYSLDDIKELQNKLMLMSGKGEQGQSEVDHFVEVFSNVQRLATTFIDLYSAGNMLFREWEATITCSGNKEVCLVMDFHLEDKINDIVVTGEAVEELPELCRRMEKCFESWKIYIDRSRSQYYFLNYYTAEQIVFLCKQLSDQNCNKLEDQVLIMLSFIKAECTLDDIREAWHQWNYNSIAKHSEEDFDIYLESFQAEVTMDINSSSNSLLHAVKDRYNIKYLPGLLSDVTAVDQVEIIWTFYMNNMEFFLPHCLKVSTLGELLAVLGNMQKNLVCRKRPAFLQEGRPNLISCHTSEVLLSSLYIYMYSGNEQLPTYDEVLLCTADTAYEQVELFIRRCLSTQYKGSKIYTMLYADRLPYEVGFRFEQLFQRLEKQSKKDYKLVVICSSTGEHCYIPSAFSQHKVHITLHEPLEKIQTYLFSHYKVPESVSSAASVFKDRMFVGIVSSKRAGVGKSLYIHRLFENLQEEKSDVDLKCIKLTEPKVDENKIVQSILPVLSIPSKKKPMIFHFDVTSSVQKGLTEFLYKMMVLNYLMDSEGQMWVCRKTHLYVVEILETLEVQKKPSRHGSSAAQYNFLDIFPKIFCRPPKEVLDIDMNKQENSSSDPLMDDKEFKSEAFQRPYQYLKRFHHQVSLDSFTYHGVEGTHVECLQLFFIYCGIVDPSWAELRNFAWFLNLQLADCENSVFCDFNLVGDTLQGFKTFVVEFMILMARDFATPSLIISDQSPGRNQVNWDGVNEEDLAPFCIRKKWESEPHPYIFFNDDHNSMTFIGFHLQPNKQQGVDAVNPTNGQIIKKNIMTQQLYEGLKLQRVPFNINFDELERGEKIERICNVLGIQWPLDPDETYELTTDNILKMLAIHMRFRCGIPVIIMGETGCGKTRLIKFLCELRRSGVATENLKLVKVHGGTSAEIIYSKVREAELIAVDNKQKYSFDSVLFFDEANTTEAVSSIKEVLCDKTAEGYPLIANSGLQIIAACNPYRKHTDEMIKRLESAGLGYRVRAEETEEKLGSIPLRQLVYRVQALPPSMIPLVWDFGQLNDQTEKIYIKQIVQRLVHSVSIMENYTDIITDVLSTSQHFMRQRSDECSFVSLRDVERCMAVFEWFFKNHVMLLNAFLGKISQGRNKPQERDPIIWSLVMAVGVCYHACLEKKESYRKKICVHLPEPYRPAKVLKEILHMQDLLLNGVPLGKTIARNNALKENVFMMVICIELRIPLFLVGKPGSSKSLAKTLVADAMQGQAAHSDLYKQLKQIHLVSFQCSPHSTPEGIINTFKQCARFQEGKNLNEYISVVVLDEIGLAEDSPKMPLKTLHPLLEEGCIDDDPLPHKKVGFIGISNWALDPAKMNRGIFVSRGDPDERELIESAKGICSSDPMILMKVQGFFKIFARAYLQICKKRNKEFFGLRDYYSLIKMIFANTKGSGQEPGVEDVAMAVLRNFSGRDDINAVKNFTVHFDKKLDQESINTVELIRQNICADTQDGECRYLLVLTKNYAALQILQQTYFLDQNQPEIIFGSSFPKDQEYTQICRNINRVKICMETGQTIVLLNLQNLYESLYDALNQYYVCLGGQKYVDLGLGTHRVKCRVHKDFRLIVIEEKDVVYKQFPIPLINRLEKHYLDINTVLKNNQKRIVQELESWVNVFVHVDNQQVNILEKQAYSPSDVFIGYHSDTCASVVLQLAQRLKGNLEGFELTKQVLEEAKSILLNCATPDSVVRLSCTALPNVEAEHWLREYFEVQKHSCLADFLISQAKQADSCQTVFSEVTTFSRLLTACDVETLGREIGANYKIELLSLQQFDTEHSFLRKIRCFLCDGYLNKILIIQSDFENSTQSANLIASAKYAAINEINKCLTQDVSVSIYVVTKLPRVQGGTSYVGFQGGPWSSVHIDDLRKSKDIVSEITALKNMTISQLFEEKAEAMEVDDSDQEAEASKTDEKFKSETILDTTSLIRCCVQNAVGMLRDKFEGSNRSTKRVQILLELLGGNKENEVNQPTDSFLNILKRRLHGMLAALDEAAFSARGWVFKEALNINALHEGGTFRHTLWKRIQAVVTPLMAQIISVIDRDCNLDLLIDCNSDSSVKRLWMDIFGDEKLLCIRCERFNVNPESTTILVQNYMNLEKNVCCTMPFSWRAKDHLDELWTYALERKGHTEKNFDEYFSKTPLGRYISAASDEIQRELFLRYVQDFILMTMSVSSEMELQFLRQALLTCVNELRLQQGIEEQAFSLTWVHSAYYNFKNRLQNFSRIINIYPKVQEVLRNNMDTIWGGEGREMVLDISAAAACIELLEQPHIKNEKSRQEWLNQVKNLRVPIELICSDDVQYCGEKCQQLLIIVRTGWNRLFTLTLFVEHLLLGIENINRNLEGVVVKHTLRLGKLLQENSDLKCEKTFLAVIDLLKECKEEASTKFFRFGYQSCPVCLGDPVNPVNLQCSHIFCQCCIKQWLTPGQMFCPSCRVVLPDDYKVEVSEEIGSAVTVNAKFRNRCNAFFIDVVSTLCFKDNEPPTENIIFHLLSLLIFQTETRSLFKKGCEFFTKSLSPFDDSVDKNPVVRSIVLKLLLKYSFKKVKKYLERHLSAVEKSNLLKEEDKTELYSLFINCLEDSMFEKLEQFSSLEQESAFLTHCIDNVTVSQHISIEYLQSLARTRLCLDVAVEHLVKQVINPDAQNVKGTLYLKSVKEFCDKSNNNWYRIYMVRKVCRQQGMEFVQQLVKEGSFAWIFPSEIAQHQSDQTAQMDPYLICGEDYKCLRDAVGKAMIEGKGERITEALKKCQSPANKQAVYLILAIFREVTMLYGATDPNVHPKKLQCDTILNCINALELLEKDQLKQFAAALVHNEFVPIIVRPGLPSSLSTVFELAIHTAAVLLCGTSEVLTPLQQLAFTPRDMKNSFLPTMPEDMLHIAQQALGPLQWYTCPNGHHCTIGECGQPMEFGRCVDCGSQIGGANHLPLPGFMVAQIGDDRTQTGHVLGDPQNRLNAAVTDTRELSSGQFILLRILTHVSMMLGVSQDLNSLSQIIKPTVPNPVEFLADHLLKDMEQLTKILGKGVDDTSNIVHLVLCSLKDQNTRPGGFDPKLTTKEARNNWEKCVATNIIACVLQNVDYQLQAVNGVIRNDKRISSNPVVKIVYGNPKAFMTTLPDDVIHCTSVWNCREKITLERLSHIVEQKNGKDYFPVLWKFLQKESEIKLVKFLPELLALQKELVKKFQNVTDINNCTIAQFIKSDLAESTRDLYKRRIQNFLTIWNQLRASLATNGEIKIPEEYCNEDLNLESDFQVLLPKRQGRGLCSTALASYLIAVHNEQVYSVEKFIGETQKYSINPSDVTDIHVIRYEVERDLIPLILSNCQYTMESGQETLPEYDLPKIEQHLIHRFLMGKPFITLAGIPTLVNRYDKKYENLFKDIKGKLPQTSLPNLIITTLSGEFQSYNDVCDALSVVEVALGFLAMTGGEPDMPLVRYVEDILQMRDQLATCILKALSRCYLKHVIALWQLLTTRKSQWMLRLKRDPFIELSSEYKQPLSDNDQSHLTAFLMQSNVDIFLLEINEFMLLNLKSVRALDTFKPTWGLKHTLIPYIEGKDQEAPPEIEDLPEEILLSHIVETWKLAVATKQDSLVNGVL